MIIFLLFLHPSQPAKFQKLSSDLFDSLTDDVGDVGVGEAETPASSLGVRARSSSQGSLHSLDDLNDKENRGKEILQDKNRRSFKLVKQMKVLRNWDLFKFLPF